MGLPEADLKEKLLEMLCDDESGVQDASQQYTRSDARRKARTDIKIPSQDAARTSLNDSLWHVVLASR